MTGVNENLRKNAPKIEQFELTRKSGLSSRRLRDLFKSETGMTFVEFCRDLKMRRARKLLAHSALSVKEIAFSLEYGAAESFCRDFKRLTACTPTEFRRNFRNNQ